MRRLTMAAFVAACASLSCGVRNVVHRKALGDLHACQDELSASKDEAGRARARIAELEKELGPDTSPAQRRAAAELSKLNAELAPTEAELLAVRARREADEHRLAEHRRIEHKLGDMTASGTVKTRTRRGRLVIELPITTLFQTGRATWTRAGKSVVQQLAARLDGAHEQRVLVAGHTDEAPKARNLKSSWQLSRQRANAIVDVLVETGFDPAKLSASGSSGAPSSGNGATTDRRMEIVLLPHEPLPSSNRVK